jgi:hypothetical protein
LFFLLPPEKSGQVDANERTKEKIFAFIFVF